MNLRLLRAVDRWRAQFNPLRGLTTQRAVTLLDEGEGGCYADLQWTYRRVEKREPTLRGLKRLRQAAIGKLDWQIRTKDDSPEAKRQADALRAAYDAIGNLNAAIRFLALAEFRGYAHLEKIYRNDDPAQGIVELCPVEQWHWVRDGLYGAWQYNATAQNVLRGAPIDPVHFVIREVDDPINEIGLLLFVEKALSKRDWVGFVEVFGIPPLFAKLPPNIPQGEESRYQEMAEAVVSDMRGVLPNGAEVTTVDAGARGANPFRDHIAYIDEQLVLAGTSGKLAMLTASTGMNSGQADAHDAVFDRLAAAEAAEIAEVLQRSIDAPLLKAKFPGAPALAWFAFDTEDEESANSVLTNAKLAKEAGFSADAAQLSEKTGLKLTVAAPVADPKAGEPPALPAVTLNRDPAPSGSELRAPSSAFLEAVAASSAPIVDLLENLPDPEGDPEGYREKLAELRERLPELMDPAGIAEALAEDMGKAAGLPSTKNRAEQGDDSEDAYFFVMNRHYHDKRDKLGRFAAAGVPLSIEDNIKSGNDALEISRRRGGQDVRNAMSREGLGTVHFVWGRPGGKHVRSGSATHADGYGVSHILAKHGEASLRTVPEVIAKGEITPHPTGNPLKRVVTWGRHQAVLQAHMKITPEQRAAVTEWEKRRKKGEDAGPFPVNRGHNRKEVFALTTFDEDS